MEEKDNVVEIKTTSKCHNLQVSSPIKWDNNERKGVTDQLINDNICLKKQVENLTLRLQEFENVENNAFSLKRETLHKLYDCYRKHIELENKINKLVDDIGVKVDTLELFNSLSMVSDIYASMSLSGEVYEEILDYVYGHEEEYYESNNVNNIDDFYYYLVRKFGRNGN